MNTFGILRDILGFFEGCLWIVGKNLSSISSARLY